VANKYTWHAEQRCIQKYKNKMNLKNNNFKFVIVLVRLNKNKEIIPSSPCSMCSHIIKKYKINVVSVNK